MGKDLKNEERIGFDFLFRTFLEWINYRNRGQDSPPCSRTLRNGIKFDFHETGRDFSFRNFKKWNQTGLVWAEISVQGIAWTGSEQTKQNKLSDL